MAVEPMLLPPDELNFVGAGDFETIGKEFLGHFIRVGGLRPHHRVLDVGCGIGRMALPLTGYLSAEGRYDGFDIVDVGIRWCQAHITPRFPNFRFHHADLFNRGYNPTGRIVDSAFEFPYPDGTFDFAFLTSVFTHMLPAGLENYLYQLARVLKVGGRVLGTFFLHTEESARLIAAGKSSLKFPASADGYWMEDPNVPEDAVMFPEADVVRLHETHGLRVDRPIHFGAWAGRTNALTSHDVVVAVKERDPVRAPSRPAVAAPSVLTRFGRAVSSLFAKGRAGTGVVRARNYARANPEVLTGSRKRSA